MNKARVSATDAAATKPRRTAPRRPKTSAAGTPSPAKAVEAPASPDTADAATRVLRRFRIVFNAVKAHFQQVEKKAGVGGAQIWAMSIIGAVPDIGVGGLAQAMDIHQTTASNLVKAMIESGAVLAVRKGIDRRKVQLRLTPAGAATLAKAPGPFSGVLPEALAQLDQVTLARLESDLSALIVLLRTDERAAGVPLGQL